MNLTDKSVEITQKSGYNKGRNGMWGNDGGIYGERTI